MNIRIIATAAIIAFLTVNTRPAHAGGIILYEIATPDVGLASAGYAARADDASTVFKNPAGMNNLRGSELQGGLQALYGSVSFSPDRDTSDRLGLNGGGNAIGWLPGGSLFLVAPLDEKWRVGFGALNYFGLASEYEADWVGRYYVQKSALLGLTLMPSVSYEATDWLSIGVGLNAMLGVLNTDLAVNNLIGPDGQMSLSDTTWGYGANVGILINAGKKTRIGVTYLSAVDLGFSAAPSFTGLGPGLSAILANPSVIDLGMKVPQSVMFSSFHQLNSQVALMFDIGWQNWSQFGYVEAGVESGGTTTLNLETDDTWHGAVGAQYRTSEKWVLSAGLAYDSSAVSDQNRTVTLPMGVAWRFGAGAQCQISPTVNLGFSTTFMWAGDMPVDQGRDVSIRGRVSGSYDSAWFSITTVNLTWKL